MDDKIVTEMTQKHSYDWQLKILILTWEYPPNVVGGLSRHVYGLSIHLAEQGHQVHVITAGNGGLSAYEIMNGVHVHRVTPLNNQDDHFLSWIAGLNLAMSYKGEIISEDIKFDIIHAHDWLVGASAITLKEVLSIPLLSTIHATEHGRNNGIHTDMQRFIHEKELQLITESDQVIACSNYMREEILGNFYLSDKKITIIPNGIEPSDSEVDSNKVFPFINNRKYIFSVGRIVKEKGFETLIEAAQAAKDRGQEIYFVIAGKGPMLERYRKMVTEKQLDHYVAFIGYVTDEERKALLANSEISVFPSLYEPFGIVALEAMILAKPTIVSETGGLKGIVMDRQTGLLMVPGDVESLLNNIDFLLQNPQTAKEIGIKGRKIVKSLYGWKRIAAQTVNVMEDTLLDKRANMSEKSR
ncbi:glycosyltransferase family 4 protein [Neobacillus sp. DY30]|uniref:glycosyltransferase family 4 protein n=1 Tax=Neobacillus sp. DY30 TaxID=3047871 RepID=UPI0024BF92E8|nr:glycosyltransferase family 4 protein [Neobacillus sp. DY30]WHX99321.1 glycosyltransferase family 4 protein [Neobacillus sp. DY30]